MKALENIRPVMLPGRNSLQGSRGFGLHGRLVLPNSP